MLLDMAMLDGNYLTLDSCAFSAGTVSRTADSTLEPMRIIIEYGVLPSPRDIQILALSEKRVTFSPLHMTCL